MDRQALARDDTGSLADRGAWNLHDENRVQAARATERARERIYMRALSSVLLGGSIMVSGLLAMPMEGRAAEPSCRVSESAALIPPSADAAIAVDVAQLTQSEPWRQDGAMLEDAPDLKDELRALKRCGIDLHSIDDVWVGAGEAAGRDNVVAIVHAPGVGSEKTMRCVAAIESLAAKPAKLQRSGCANTLEVEDEAQLVGLDLDHLAIVSRSWVKTVIQRARAGERAAGPAATAKQLSSRSQLRFAAKLDGALKQGLGPVGEPIQSLAGSLLVGRAFHGELIATTRTPAEASELESSLSGYLGLARGLASSVGMPAELFDKISISRERARVIVKFEALYSDLKRAAASIDK